MDTTEEAAVEENSPFNPYIYVGLLIGLIAMSLYVLRVFLYGGPTLPWRVSFFPNSQHKGKPFELGEFKHLDFDWENQSLVAVRGGRSFSVRAETCLRISKPTDILFSASANNDLKLLVNTKVEIDATRLETVEEQSKLIRFNPGLHHVVFESSHYKDEDYLRVYAENKDKSGKRFEDMALAPLSALSGCS